MLPTTLEDSSASVTLSFLPGDGAEVARIGGELDLATAPVVADQLLRSLHGNEGLDLDLADLSFCDTSGINLFLRLNRLARSENKRLRLTNVPAQPARVIRTLGLQHELDCDFLPDAARLR